MPAIVTHSRFARWFSVLTLACILLLIQFVHFDVAVAAPDPPPVQIYYVPVPEDQVFAALSGIYPGNAACGKLVYDVKSPIHTYVSISIISAGTIVYYDQWEDDFEIDIAHPVQPTTQIWGDANPANGAPPGISSDILAPDTVIVLNNEVPVPRQPQNRLFDGGDKIGASRPIAMTRATWSGSYPGAPGTLLADAIEVYDTGRWGVRYQAPVGETTATNQIFEYTGMAIMAKEDGTIITIDANADLAAEAAITLNEGESYLANGGIQAGMIVNASAPVQVALITGDRCDIYESRWFVLFPTERWSDSYYTPVGTVITGSVASVWVFNPNPTSLTVSWEAATGARPPLSIAPLTAISALMPSNSGAHFLTTDGRPFAALATIDAGNPDPGYNSYADWGFTLVPESQLTYQTLVGWGAGRDPTSSTGLTENGSPVWVTPVLSPTASSPVSVCVDYDGNNDGPRTDINGFEYDELLSLARLESRQVFDPDGDQTGMVLYVCDARPSRAGAKIATAWGQASEFASAAEPGLDLGTTAPPASTFEAGKGADIMDEDQDGKADPGDVIQYTIVVRNASRVPLTTVHISDTVPAYTTYIASSTFVGTDSSVFPVADNPTGTPFPLDEGGIDLAGLLVRASYTVTFDVRVDFPLPPDLDRVRNVAFVQVGEDTQQPEVETPVDLDADITLTKYTNGQHPAVPPGPEIDLGAPVTWTYVITNTGTVTLTNVSVTDSISGVFPQRVQGEADAEGNMPLGAVWVYEATGIAAGGQYSNTGTVTALGQNDEPAGASDISFYFGGRARIALVKEASASAVLTGTTVFYTFTITNSGTDVLHDVVLTDDHCAPLVPVIGGSGSLPIGEHWVFRCSAVILEDTTNVAVVTALDSRGNPVTDTDTWTVDIPFLYLPWLVLPPQPCPPPAGCPLAYTKGFAVDETRNLLYVTSRNPDRLLVVNPTTAQVVASAEAGSEPWGVVVDEGSRRIYVSNFGSDDVWIYDATTLNVLAKIAVGDQPALMEILPDIDTVFAVVRGGSRIAVIQGTTMVQDVSSGGSGPFGIAADPVNQRIFVSNRDSRHLATLRKVGGQWEAHSSVVFDDGRSLFDLAYNPKIGRLYSVYAAADGNWFVDVWKPSDTELWGREATIAVGSGGDLDSPLVGGAGLAVDLATGNVFNVNTGARSLSVVDSVQNRVKATIALGDDPFPVAINAVTKTVFVGLRTPGRLIKIEDNY